MASLISEESSKPNNFWCWLLILYPFLMSFTGIELEYIFIAALQLAASMIFITLDRRALANAELRSPHPLWGILFFPVYLWKRENILGRRWKPMFLIFTGAYTLYLALIFPYLSSIRIL